MLAEVARAGEAEGDLAVISVPGDYAALEAHKALGDSASLMGKYDVAAEEVAFELQRSRGGEAVAC